MFVANILNSATNTSVPIRVDSSEVGLFIGITYADAFGYSNTIPSTVEPLVINLHYENLFCNLEFLRRKFLLPLRCPLSTLSLFLSLKLISFLFCVLL